MLASLSSVCKNVFVSAATRKCWHLAVCILQCKKSQTIVIPHFDYWYYYYVCVILLICYLIVTIVSLIDDIFCTKRYLLTAVATWLHIVYIVDCSVFVCVFVARKKKKKKIELLEGCDHCYYDYKRNWLHLVMCLCSWKLDFVLGRKKWSKQRFVLAMWHCK